MAKNHSDRQNDIDMEL